MEEDIKLLEEMKNNCLTKREYIDEKAERKAQAIENLINKYKELRQEVAKYEIQAGKLNQNMVSALEEAFKYSLEIKDLERQNKEQEKIIELMAEKLAIYKFEEIICMETECEHVELQNEGKCIGDKECILEYFKKKAREENEI